MSGKTNRNQQKKSDGITRRDFLKLAGVLGAGAVYSAYFTEIETVFGAVADGSKHMIWLQGASDTGCTISLLQGVNPDLIDAVTQFKIASDFNPTIMIPSGDAAVSTLKNAASGTTPLDILVVEGAIPTGNYCTIGESGGKPVPVETWVKTLGAKAKYVVAVGTCASFGGIPGGAPNPTGCRSVGTVLGRTVINIPGCPAHPDWVLLTLATILSGTSPSLDTRGMPRAFFSSEDMHDHCPLHDRYYEHDRFASRPGEMGCLMRLGCKGPDTRGDCPQRLWNNKTAFCMSGPWVNGVQTINAGAPCIGCTMPGFPDAFSPFSKVVDD